MDCSGLYCYVVYSDGHETWTRGGVDCNVVDMRHGLGHCCSVVDCTVVNWTEVGRQKNGLLGLGSSLLEWVNLSKRRGKDGVFRGQAGLLRGISRGRSPREVPRSSPASPR